MSDPAPRRVADELEIRNVVARLAQLADTGEIDAYVDLFTEDAVWDMPGSPRRGRDDIRAGALERRRGGTAGPGSDTRHVISTVAVTADGGDTATAESYWLFYGDSAATPKLQLLGSYRDTFRRTPQGGKLAHRRITFG